MKTLQQHLAPGLGKKRILSLDGGGIKGALTVAYLEKIEKTIQVQSGNDKLRLCDYFDLIGGTSTGAIIAAALAIGLSAAEVKDRYLKLGGKIFGEKRDWWKPWETAKYLKAKFDHEQLERELKNVFGDILMGGEEILTGLCIVAKRADTNSTWPVINHPSGKFFNSSLGKNKNIPLWKMVRASTAAPTYFAPQMIDVGNGHQAAFIDGGLSMSNNPSTTLLMVATLNGFPFHWKLGSDNLSLLSLGTGYQVFAKQTGEISDSKILDWAKNVPNMLMQDAKWHNQVFMQWISDSPTNQYIDMEIGDLGSDRLGDRHLIQYLRYDCELSENYLSGLGLGFEVTKNKVESLNEMSNAFNRNHLYEIGCHDSVKISPNHFLNF